MMDKIIKNCGNCGFSFKKPQWAYTECRRLPPNLTFPGKDINKFPTVLPDDYVCGEWQGVEVVEEKPRPIELKIQKELKILRRVEHELKLGKKVYAKVAEKFLGHIDAITNLNFKTYQELAHCYTDNCIIRFKLKDFEISAFYFEFKFEGDDEG